MSSSAQGSQPRESQATPSAVEDHQQRGHQNMSSRANDNQLRDNLTMSFSAQDNQQKYQNLITNCGNLESLTAIACVFYARLFTPNKVKFLDIFRAF